MASPIRSPQPQRPSGLGYLGPRGEPKSIEASYRGVNPNYWKGIKWRENCQRVVFAYEMSRRGYDVEARERLYNGDTLPYAYDRQGWMAVFKDMLKQEVRITSVNEHDQVVRQMTKWGTGARAIVHVRWAGTNSGHVFNAEVLPNGSVVFVDAQIGRQINLNGYLDKAAKGETTLVRVDNLEPTELLRKCVKRKGT